MKRQATALLLGLTFSAGALAQSATATATVTVLPDRYVFAGRAYEDLGRLEDAVRAARPAALAMDSCGPRETRALLAAFNFPFRN